MNVTLLRNKIFLITTIATLLCACSGHYQHNLNFDPSEHLRVAVLPFVSVDSKGKIIQEEGRLLLDNLSLVSAKLNDTPAQILRREVQAELPNSGLDLLSSALIDIDLPHHGYAKSDGTIDLEKLFRTDAKELCTKFLDCDAVLYGKVTKWERNYYGLQSVNTVGLELKLVAARDGRELFSASAEDSESRGITKIPTGFSSVVLEPIKGLDSNIIVDLSRTVVKKLLEPLNLKTRPEFLNSTPPVIYASAHDATSGLLNRGSRLIVVAMGNEHQQASFAVGTAVPAVQMFERSPGHYYGEYEPIAGEHFENQVITVSISDKYGRVSTQQTPQKAVSLR